MIVSGTTGGTAATTRAPLHDVGIPIEDPLDPAVADRHTIAEWSKLLLDPAGVGAPAPAEIPEALSQWAHEQLTKQHRLDTGTAWSEVIDPNGNRDDEPDWKSLQGLIDRATPEDAAKMRKVLRFMSAAMTGDMVFDYVRGTNRDQGRDDAAAKTVNRLDEVTRIATDWADDEHLDPIDRASQRDRDNVRSAIAAADEQARRQARQQIEDRIRDAEARGWRHPAGGWDGRAVIPTA